MCDIAQSPAVALWARGSGGGTYNSCVSQRALSRVLTTTFNPLLMVATHSALFHVPFRVATMIRFYLDFNNRNTKALP
jgi:hypothetical protein